MIEISANDINKFYGANHVLKGISFEIFSGEKVGLLGKNGSGKTTMFKIITGDEPFDSGNLAKASGRRLEMLAQIPEFGDEATVEDVLRSSFSEITEVYKAMKAIEGDLGPDTLARYGRLMEKYEHLGGYETEVRLDKVASGMNIDDGMRKSLFRRLSGGERARVNLSRILLRECDILLLDEPTNHLDLPSLEWLEAFLRDFPGTVVAVSHDRVFLDRVATRIIEIDQGKAHFYSGNFSWYIEERQRRFEAQSEQYERQQKEIKRIEDRARWFVEQNKYTTKHHALLSRLDHMDKIDRPTTSRKLGAGFDSGGYAAKELVSLDSVSKRYGDKVLMRDVNLKIRRNDRIALVGANGCGKTTLLKMLLGEEPLDHGNIKISPNAKIGYMPQIITFADESATVLETLRAETGASAEKARSILASFLFYAEDVTKRVDALSGGEKSRLKLCLLMQENINLLLLDEPTNHLDIASREWIENALTDFEGTMLFISHDRYFLNKFAACVWSMVGGGIAKMDIGFEEFIERSRRGNQPDVVPAKTSQKGRTKAPPPKSEGVSIEKQIAEAEAELGQVEAEIESDLSKAEFSRMNELYEKKNQLTQRIDSLLGEWLDNGEKA